MNMTLEERERAAYIAGDTALAEVLAKADDLAAENESLQDEICDLEDRLPG